jgi:hypothetical protein
MDFFLGQTFDANYFVTGAGASENVELGLREIKQVGEERETGGVGRSFHRRRRQPDLESLASPACDGIARGTGLDMDGQRCLRESCTLNGHRRHP